MTTKRKRALIGRTMTGVAGCALAAVPVAATPLPNTAADGAAATAEATATSDDIVVTGNRLAERRALQAKRSADNAVEALYANDVGKLPDQNVAEAVRRLPGLSVANDQGESRYVIIRGVNPNLVNVVLNGLTLPAPEPDGRQVKLDDIPSALISSVVVTKSLTPDRHRRRQHHRLGNRHHRLRAGGHPGGLRWDEHQRGLCPAADRHGV